MRNRFLIYGIFISIGIHFIFLSNIRIDNKIEKPFEIQLVQIPPKINKDNLLSNKVTEEKTEKKYYKKKEKLKKIKHKNEEIYCSLCKPVDEIPSPATETIFGKKVQSIEMFFKVFHDLGPNKGTISKIKPFGSDGGVAGVKDSNTISSVGNVNINYVVNQNKYKIYYEANAQGISSFFYTEPLIQQSKGLISNLGLRPEYYLYSHKNKESEVFFNWSKKTLMINRNKTSKSYDLIDQAQDQLSFMFQFMFLDPLNKMQIPITNAKVFKIYNYQYVEELDLDTKLGIMDVLHVAKFNYQNHERIDLWLAKEYGYLPVKISVTEDDLSTIIQKIETLKVKKVDE